MHTPLRLFLSLVAVSLVTGCASLSPTSPSVPVEVSAAPFGEQLPEGYVPVFVRTSGDERFSAFYMAWDWSGETRPEGPTSMVLLFDQASDETFELVDFRNKRLEALNWQADNLMRMRSGYNRVFVQVDQAQDASAPPEVYRTTSRSHRSLQRSRFTDSGPRAGL